MSNKKLRRVEMMSLLQVHSSLISMSKVSFHLPPLNEINLKAFTGGGLRFGHFTLHAEFLQLSPVSFSFQALRRRGTAEHTWPGAGGARGGSRPAGVTGEAALAAGTPGEGTGDGDGNKPPVSER